MIANQCLKAAPSPEVRILNLVPALNRDANIVAGRLQSAGGAVGIIDWLPAEWRLREIRTINEALINPRQDSPLLSPPLSFVSRPPFLLRSVSILFLGRCLRDSVQISRVCVCVCV